ncbi:RrF2 family transcriptional regulator [Micromonospora sp. NBC_01813]|uniref:RrF2 family transcriptional regulator n=1 Tax=Micromonospora sp. NBC_01813 TaxID=2975988 RepID=UPI002DDC54A9|nr:Rrf2 family transcriptional regulator [Micromonospora sp. NBC_01813]WSA09220.1 Rrf2 family transcriptional regulator [Micromonospora sp. NBC_01813]
MFVSARSDYALRAMLSIAAEPTELVKASTLAKQQELPLSFLQGILLDLRRAGLLHSHRGGLGGYQLTKPAAKITVGEVLRAMTGTLTTVRGLPVEAATYDGVATGLRDVWLAVNDALERVVDGISLADLLTYRNQTAQTSTHKTLEVDQLDREPLGGRR